MAFALLAFVGSVPAWSKERTITILHTNDMHGRHAPFHVALGVRRQNIWH